MAKGRSRTTSIDGHRLAFTSLDKVMYPKTGMSKGEVIEYYRAIAPVILPYLAGRPATRKQWVNGVGTADAPGEVFFHKNLDRDAPSWIRRRTIQHADHSNDYPLIDDTATLLWFVQRGTLEFHVPQWRFGPRGAQRNPDRLVLDLDPGDGVGLAECVQVARIARDRLSALGFDAHPVTSGSKGIHLYAAADGKRTSERLTEVAKELADSLEADHPDLIVATLVKEKRRGRVFVDWNQNLASRTTVAPYSLRGRLRPTVAAPRTWDELDSADGDGTALAQLDYREVLERVDRDGDLLGSFLGGRA
ncbi:MAG TPA: non-homologous end-joining DNA ligase [Terrimesophilobacter sp.]|nr:non-homologous end-joining DNA ligase [Terrimesophilobacter sp.]